MYSLFMQSRAWLERRPIRILAVEPAPGVLERLRFNVDASGAADIEVLPWAATERREEVTLYLNTCNRGETSLLGVGAPVSVEGHSLWEIMEHAACPAIDALKIDIEGAELPTVRGLFEQGEPTLWPRLVVIEGESAGRNSAAIDYVLKHGYSLQARTHMNSILRRG